MNPRDPNRPWVGKPRERPPGRVPEGETLPEFCRVDGCIKPRKVGSRGWCKAHYTRWLRTGEVGCAEIGATSWATECSSPDCERPTKGGGRGMCQMHYLRFRRSPQWQRLARPGAFEESAWMWTGEDATYEAAHFRIHTRRGPARQFDCVAGCGSPAAQWAYDHNDPAVKTSPQGWLYSLRIEHYIPMCRKCHKALDRLHRNSKRRAA